jgi:hypothetical protein
MELPDRSLLSIAAKIARAREHAQTLWDECGAWQESEPCTLEREYDPELFRWTWRARFASEPNLVRWGLLAGDALNNARNALDHLFHAIATHEQPGPLPRHVASKLAFPITNDPGEWGRKRADRGLDFLSPGVWAAIEAVQPHNRPDRDGKLLPPLRLLRSICNADKHELLRPVVNSPEDWVYKNNPWVEDEIGSIARNGGRYDDLPERFEDGAVVGGLSFDVPTPEMYPVLDTTVAICLQHAVGPSGRDVSGAARLVRWLVDEADDVVTAVRAALP